jgi:hypothetical protein
MENKLPPFTMVTWSLCQALSHAPSMELNTSVAAPQRPAFFAQGDKSWNLRV